MYNIDVNIMNIMNMIEKRIIGKPSICHLVDIRDVLSEHITVRIWTRITQKATSDNIARNRIMIKANVQEAIWEE